MPTTRRPGSTPRTPPRTGSSRPAAAARGRRPSEELRTPRSVKRLAILAAIFVMLAVTLIPTMRSTLNQQSQISAMRDRLAQQRETVGALRQEQQQWSDPAYVEQQARERLKFVRVGETSYTVIGAEAAPDAGGPQIVSPVLVSTANSPWYSRLWQSMVIADTSANVSAESPATGSPATGSPAGSQPATNPAAPDE